MKILEGDKITIKSIYDACPIDQTEARIIKTTGEMIGVYFTRGEGGSVAFEYFGEDDFLPLTTEFLEKVKKIEIPYA